MTKSSEGVPTHYIAGHDSSVLRIHSVRDVHGFAAHLLPFLKAGQSVLDVGCGPGSLTISIAETVGPGKVIGVDIGEPAITQAESTAKEKHVTNVEFAVGDAIAGLPFPDSSFDVVHAHQVLQHVSEPLAILREMRRLAKKPGGIVSIRESDLGTFNWYPISPALENYYHNGYARVIKAQGADANAGRQLHVWCKEAGYSKDEMVVVQTAAYSIGQRPGLAGKEEREWWATTFADRIARTDIGMAKAAFDMGLVTKEELGKVVKAWRDWGASEDAWFGMMIGEIVCVLDK
ncbi:MAG: hypothetical protein CYPHOPRED_001286 [Cyphobasidiales sp. Tagirdzhanova-0007]|nr:MAG: hypothetical protein CYPHOPRED_001286 [Cyphobasidiales sp. Tagirdzhanova-0007]